MLDYVPDFDFFDRDVRNCFIVEDCDIKLLTKDERYKLGRFFGVYASHNNIDIYVVSQNVFDILPQIRRLANICFLFKNNHIECMSSVARKFNVKVQDLKNIFSSFNKFDSLCIDDSRKPEYRLRKNIYEIIRYFDGKLPPPSQSTTYIMKKANNITMNHKTNSEKKEFLIDFFRSI